MRFLIFIPLFLISCQIRTPDASEKIKFYVGAADRNLENSIVFCELDLTTGELTKVDSFPGTKSSSYLALSPDNKFLYALNSETGPDNKTQQVTSFSVNPETGALKLLNSQSSEGSGACHISVHPSGKYVFTANYSSGTIAVHPVNEDGSLAEASDVKQHEGTGPDEERQEAAHAHFICADPQGNYVLAVDLGIDKVMDYIFDEATGELNPNPEQRFFETSPGAGPRHLAFHPSGNHLYLLNELNGTLTACSYDQDRGVISEINTLMNLPADFSGFNKSAAVRVHPEGKFVYASNRGDLNSITVFKIREDGSIEQVQVQDQHINWPRDFNIDPSGTFLLAENKLGNSIVVFRIDPESGKLVETGKEIPVRQPSCIVFLDK
ncbi:MAG: lactonase family protein [Bacteroidales bacterium]|nr:lactonase family protein [Bacteroidales bacterium]